MKKTLVLLCALIIALCPALRAQTTIFDCHAGFNNTNGQPCSAPTSYNGNPGSGWAFSGNWGPLTGSAGTLVPVGQTHNGNVGSYYNGGSPLVNIQAFTTTFTFTPNGYNLALVIQNNNIHDGYPAGAGAEGGFSQYAGPPNVQPNNIFALQFDSYSSLANSPNTFSYSSVQIYQTLQAPFMPNAGGNGGSGGPQGYPINKTSTSPVPLNSPAGTPASPTGDVYSATLGYDGWTLNLCLVDVTAANGTCASATSGTGTYFTNSWSGVLIPEIVGGNTASIGFSAGVGATAANAILINGWKYVVNTPTGTPSFTAWNANSTYNDGTASAASPVYSIAPGNYSGTQSVSITTSKTPYNYVCYVLSSSTPTFYPQPNNNGGCAEGTLYTGPVSISSTATLYAMAASNVAAFGTGSTSSTPAGLGPPSTLVSGTYTIGGTSPASTPTFSLAAGTYTGAQTVNLSTSSGGATICYTLNGASPATNGSTGCATGSLYSSAITVETSETVKAVAGGSGYTDSSIGSAAYTIKATTPTFSPVAGTYTGSQSVTISATLGSTICYNFTGSPATNGTTGCTTGTKYTGPVSVPSSDTLYAIAGGTGVSDGSVGSAAYTIDTGAATPTFSPAAGTYSSAQSVALSTTSPGATICWNTTGNPSPTPNGSNGCTIGTLYTAPISVSSSQTIYAAAGGTGYNNSSVGNAAYVITSATATPTFSLASGAYTLPVSLTISDPTGGAVISYCTTTYLANCVPGSTYSNPLTIGSPESICAKAIAAGHTVSSTACVNITAPSAVTLMIGGKVVYSGTQ